MSDPTEPNRPASGTGRAAQTAEERAAEQELENDALLDSLLFEDAAALPAPAEPELPSNIAKLHQPSNHQYSEDDVTVVGRGEDLFAEVSSDDGTTGLEDLASSDIDELLSSMPASPIENVDAWPYDAPVQPSARLPDVSAGLRLPAPPRPIARSTSGAPRPEAVATSTEAPPASAGPGSLLESLEPDPASKPNEDEEEQTRFFLRDSPVSVIAPGGPRPETDEEHTVLLHPLQVEQGSGREGPEPSRMPEVERASRVSAHSEAEPTPGWTAPPATSLLDAEFELFSGLPNGFSAADHKLLDEPAQASDEVAQGLLETQSSPLDWPDERPARAHLGGNREAFAMRAEWLEREAHAASNPQARARALTIASELWALTGDLPRARDAAGEASAIPRAQGMAARQMRALAAAEGDFKAVAPALEMEIRGAATAEARVHAAYLSAEVYRLALNDEATGKKKLDLAVRAQQDDPRAHVAKLSELLGKGSGPVRMRFPDSEPLSELSHACEELLRLRGGAPSAGSAQAVGPRAAFEEARRALSTGDRRRAADALATLAVVPGLGHACAWLSASLLGADPSTRARAILELGALAERGGGRLARRALVARALEEGNAQVIREAVSGAVGAQTFAASDRLALAALIGLTPQGLETTIEDVAADPALRPLAAAFVAAAPSSTLDVRSGSEASRAEQHLGHALVSPPAGGSGLEHLLGYAQAFRASHPESPLARFLSLELARVSRSASQVALALSEWPRTDEGPQRTRDERLAVALVHELAGEQASAVRAYRQALDLDPSNEPAVRALSKAVPEETADLLLRLADHVQTSERGALILLEAALRLGLEPREAYDSLVERARLAAPDLPLSYRMAEDAARRRADHGELLVAVRARREAADDPVERSLDLVREALLLADTDLTSTERLLNEARKARPDDLALQELAERTVPTEDVERAAWREAIAETSQGALRGRLFAEAALERARAFDPEGAARDAYLAVEHGAGGLTPIAAERFAAAGPGAARLASSLLDRARASEEPAEQRQLYERLSHIDRSRGDTSSALLWQIAILEQSPDNLPALRRLEHAYINADRLDELESIAASLARTLDASEANAHARLTAHLRVRRGAWLETRDMAEIAIAHAPSELWALRTLSAHARVTFDSELGLRCDERLFELSERPLDKGTLALRAAEAAVLLERGPDTKRLLAAALEQVPDHWLALSTLAEVLEASEEYPAAARALERAAQASNVPAHQVSAWYRAAVLWLDRVGDGERGRAALECAVTVDFGHEDAVVRLQALYAAVGERQKLAELLQRRLERTTDPEERIAIEVARGRALAEAGERDAAKAALSSALDANPDHAEALEAFAGLCLAEGDWGSAERALIRLARHTGDPERQAQIYRRLGELYDTALPNPERAELAYKEVLKRAPEDGDTVARLVQVHGRLGDTTTALSLQTDLLARAHTPEEKRARTLALAIVEEQIVGDRKRAELTFDRARKEWPHDSTVLRAIAEFQRRGGETRSTQMMLDRAAMDARRALATGRFEPSFFEVLATVAELKNTDDSWLVARATLAALHGEELPVPAAGPVAGDPRLDDLLTPDLVSPPLRALLKKSGDILDAAYPVDLGALNAAPLPASSAAFESYVQQVAAAFGLRGLEVLASRTLGPVCVPVSTAPPQIVFGQALLDSEDDAARYFLLIRSLKILQGSAAALSRTAAVELWPVLAGFLNLLAPSWIPQGVDAKKLAETQSRISAVMRRNLDDDVPVLALEVIGAIGNRASLLATALYQWGNRCALLSAGSLVASLRGVALASGQPGPPPPEGAERVKWIVRNAEARDLATFAVSEQYAEARSRLGLSR